MQVPETSTSRPYLNFVKIYQAIWNARNHKSYSGALSSTSTNKLTEAN